MAEYEIDGRKYLIDEDGYLEAPEVWNEKVARIIARDKGIPDLTDGHWEVINFVREYYIVHGIAPTMRRIVKGTGFSIETVTAMFASDTSSIGKVCGMQNPAICT